MKKILSVFMALVFVMTIGVVGASATNVNHTYSESELLEVSATEDRAPLLWWEWLRVPTHWILYFFAFGWVWMGYAPSLPFGWSVRSAIFG